MEQYEDRTLTNQMLRPAENTELNNEIVLTAKRVLAPGKGLGRMYILDDVACPTDVLHVSEEIPRELIRLENTFATYGNPFAKNTGDAALRIMKLLQVLEKAEPLQEHFSERFIPELLSYSTYIKGTALLYAVQNLRAKSDMMSVGDNTIRQFITDSKQELSSLIESIWSLKGETVDGMKMSVPTLTPVEMQKLSSYTAIRDTMFAARQLVRKGHDAAWSVYSCFTARIEEYTKNISDLSVDVEQYPERARSLRYELDNVKAKREEVETARTQMIRIMEGTRIVPKEPVIVVGSVVQVPTVDHIPESLQSGIIAEIGEQSHIVIVALSERKPVVVPTTAQLDILKKLGAQTPVLVDGDAGEIIIEPSKERIVQFYRERQNQPVDTAINATTRDGVQIELQLNVSAVNEDILKRIEHFQISLGLVRTELVFRKTGVAQTTPQHQEAAYRSLLIATPGEVVLRTWDLSHDKAGMRSAAVPLDEEDAVGLSHGNAMDPERELGVQLMCILRAAHAVDEKATVLFPQINTHAEMQNYTDMLYLHALKDSGIHFQSDSAKSKFIQTISTAVQIESLAGVDNLRDILKNTIPVPKCIAIGTNDLGMEVASLNDVHAGERGTGDVDHYSPFLLLAIEEIVTTARRITPDIPVEVCGQMASLPEFVPVLLGLGIRRLSADMNSVQRVEQACSQYTISECELLVSDLLACSSSEQVEDKLRQFNAARQS